MAQPVPVASDDSTAALRLRLAELEQRFEDAVEVAKVQALYHFAYGLSHEINNPLANIATRAQTLLLEEEDPERRRKLATINQQAFRAHEMIADLMLFARPPALRREDTDLAAIADEVVAELHDSAQAQKTRLVRSGEPGPLFAVVDRTQIAVALRALVQNALEAVRSAGRVEVRLEVEDSAPVPPPHFVSSSLQNPKAKIQALKLTVTDTGPGIPPEIRPHLFDPFFSGREAGRGLGLGLCKAWRIVELHGGRMDVESQLGEGAEFSITLPVSSVAERK